MGYSINVVSNDLQEIVTDNGSVAKVQLLEGDVKKVTTDTNVTIADLTLMTDVLKTIFHVSEDSLRMDVRISDNVIDIM